MLNLERFFKKAEAEFGLQRETSKKGTMEVLKYKNRGVAWRWIRNNTIQLCPPTKGRNVFRDDKYLVIQGKTSECRYIDPNQVLDSDMWSYSGCDCTNVSEIQVWSWIESAYNYQKSQ